MQGRVDDLSFFEYLYPEWPHRQGGCLTCCSCTIESSWVHCFILYARGAQGVLPMRVGGATSQLDLPSLTPLSVADCGWLQLGVPNWAASVYCKLLIIDPTFCGSRFSTGRLVAIEDFMLPNCRRKQNINNKKWSFVSWLKNQKCCIIMKHSIMIEKILKTPGTY